MEFPDLGRHCELPSCKQLDFLPYTCNACKKTFCAEHRTFEMHNCPEMTLLQREKQFPACPVCERPVPLLPGEDPNKAVSEHLDRGCQAKKIYTNSCNKKGCKQRELVPVRCDKCKLTFCLRHRFWRDHACAVAKQEEDSRKSGGRTLSIGPFVAVTVKS